MKKIISWLVRPVNFSVRTGCVFVGGLIGVGMDGEVKGPTAKSSWNCWGCDDSLCKVEEG
jgi:hypothetical protein